MNLNVFEATEDHVKSLQGRLRASDIQEIAACSGRDPDVALLDSWRRSEYSRAFVLEGKTILIFGVGRQSLISDTGVPWLLGSKEMDSRQVGNEVGRWSRYYVDEMKSKFSRLENWIDTRQRRSIRWLKWCGFHVERSNPFGVLDLPFHLFWMEKK